MDFQNQLRIEQKIVNDYLNRMMDIKEAPKSIVDGMSYSLLAGGKRIRPVLANAICKALGGDSEEILPFACSIECIHTYSLIHDDLPSMDNDDYRRGKLTNHRVFGEAHAILAGDGLLNLAFETMIETVKKYNYKPKFIMAMEEICRASGVRGMIGGQIIDIESEGKKIEIETLYKMHEKKTGALIEASCIAGCVISERFEMIDIVKDYSKNLGIAFQIVDDILDYTGTLEKLGKNVGVDAANKKSTFVSLLGLEESQKLAEQYTENALKRAEYIDKSGFITSLTQYLLNRES
ncbi:farnesyl-diphosphate synthase [Fervidicella metallireducens AeB]|uniref:Farnesyl diphosphate synthase n=1 Tax=Fervidicella metallireducens AeB TaxID=1403537 RepID=A0A017RYF4_9CLOT|nr:farnesyl diphosphate synthase [Fervidicella metallireducens]EYE89702.1 farnesyl-diphosphate synthase [Fervidicella metallireducens AeB]